jgi:hypothetical protein
MNRSVKTIDHAALYQALRRTADREATARRRRQRPGFWRRVFGPSPQRREHVARLSPSEVVHNNLEL